MEARRLSAKPERRSPPPDVREALTRLPAVDEAVRVLSQRDGTLPHWALVEAARAAIDERRRALVTGTLAPASQGEGALDWSQALAQARALLVPSLRPVWPPWR